MTLGSLLISRHSTVYIYRLPSFVYDLTFFQLAAAASSTNLINHNGQVLLADMERVWAFDENAVPVWQPWPDAAGMGTPIMSFTAKFVVL